MSWHMDDDRNRFKKKIEKIVKGSVSGHLTNRDLIGKKGDHIVRIPIPIIDIPRFRYDTRDTGGVGQGKGDLGDSLGGDGEEGNGKGEAGENQGQHIYEEIELRKIIEFLAEDIDLDLQPKPLEDLVSEKNKYNSIGPSGVIRHKKKTILNSIKRGMAEGTYNPDNPIFPIKDDFRYRIPQPIFEQKSNAVIFYMMDISGSMGREQKDLVRTETYWLSQLINHIYPGVEEVYITHESVAKEVSETEFFHTSTSGGTIISTAYQLCLDIIKERYNTNQWNIYPFHFSDGDNFSFDREKAIELAKELTQTSNFFCYGQCPAIFSGKFIETLNTEVKRKLPKQDQDKIRIKRLSEKGNDYEILADLKYFIGKKG